MLALGIADYMRNTLGYKTYAYHAPATKTPDYLVITPMPPEIKFLTSPDYLKGEFTVVHRNNNYQAGLDAMETLVGQLTLERVDMLGITVIQSYPQTETMVYPPNKSEMVEFSVRFHCTFGKC